MSSVDCGAAAVGTFYFRR